MDSNLHPAGNSNNKKREVVSIRKEPFNLASALTWWKSKDGEFMSGQFNLDLYKDILDLKSKIQ